MLYLQHILILSIIIFINVSNSSTITIESTTDQSIYDNAAAEIIKIENDEQQLKLDRHKLEEEKKQIEKQIKNIDVIRLNVGGEIIMTTRQTLTKIPKSILSMIFNGRWEHKLKIDQNENIFLDFNPILFRHLLVQLQLFDSKDFINFFPPSDPSLVIPFKKMIQKLGLNKFLSSQKNIITFNVGGQIITTRHRTFNKTSNSTPNTIVQPSKIDKFHNKSDVFLDYDPKLFQNLVNQLRGESLQTIAYLKLSLKEEKISFQRMLNDLGIAQQLDLSTEINLNTKWKQNGITIAGGNGKGDELNQLDDPYGIYVDDDEESIYIADYANHRTVEWKFGAKGSHVVAGGKGNGSQMDQLNGPNEVIVDKKNDSLIICDTGNSRVIRWPRRNGKNGQPIISDINCGGLTMDNHGNLYVVDFIKDEVRRWKIGETNGTIVAGGNGKGNQLNQLNCPTYMFVDENHSVYVSDRDNHRVMKWMKGAKEGIVVAGGQGEGNSLTQLAGPVGVIVDGMGNVYVADSYNDRIMRWLPGAKEGSIVVVVNGSGQQAHRLTNLRGLSFDRQGNLYVVEYWKNQVLKFDIISN